MASEPSSPSSGFLLQHPYFPEDAVIAGYKENETPLLAVLGSFAGVIAILLLSSVAVARRINPMLSLSDFGMICWFVLSGFLHCFFEGYFILYGREIPGSQGLFAQLWKEYSLSDSRYLVADTFVVCIESITVLFWGPCCLAVAICIVRGNSLRYPLQIVACLAHLYGVALYYSTSYVDKVSKGVLHSRPEFQYFWIYYVGMNLPWAVIPGVILFKTVRRICQVFDAFEASEKASQISRDSAHASLVGQEAKKAI